MPMSSLSFLVSSVSQCSLRNHPSMEVEFFFLTKKEGTARLPTTSAGFFWVLFVREARYIVWVGTKKVPGGQTILSL